MFGGGPDGIGVGVGARGGGGRRGEGGSLLTGGGRAVCPFPDDGCGTSMLGGACNACRAFCRRGSASGTVFAGPSERRGIESMLGCDVASACSSAVNISTAV